MPSGGTGESAGPPLTLLLIEGDETSAELFKRVLRRVRAPGVCCVVPDGQEAVRYLTGAGPYADRRRHPLPCLIVLELMLPRMNGFEFLAWRRSRGPLARIPVFAFTICDDPEEHARAKALGVTAFWSKTGDLRRLESMARRIAVYLRQFCNRVRREVAADA